MEMEITRGNGNSGYSANSVAAGPSDLPPMPQPVDRLMPGMATAIRHR